MRKIRKDITGKKFGRLQVLEIGPKKTGQYNWWCLCDCGEKRLVAGGDLRSGHTRSCGCLKRDRTIETHTTHGKSRSPEFSIWRGIRKRCNTPTAHAFEHYGGRGIKICSRWDNFENFLADMGPRPTPKHSVERIDHDGDYCPENCKWVIWDDQANNRRNTHFVVINGERMSLKRACEKHGRRYNRTSERIRKLKWSVEEAFELVPRRSDGR